MIAVRTSLPGEPAGSHSVAALPAGALRGVVVLHEAFGPQPEIERVVQRFANAGYAAVAPDLFGPGGKTACLVRTLYALQTGEGPQIDQIHAARAWLCKQTGLAEERVGLIGFCLGGGFALVAGRGWGAISSNYGYVPRTEQLRGLGPTIACYGGRDRFMGHLGGLLDARLRKAGVEREVHTFPDVGHAFLTDGDYTKPDRFTGGYMYTPYDPRAAEEGWRRIFAFLDEHLGDQVAGS
jgi:carboxymethylenebutenolidase